jgi:hypothetical protein
MPSADGVPVNCTRVVDAIKRQLRPNYLNAIMLVLLNGSVLGLSLGDALAADWPTLTSSEAIIIFQLAKQIDCHFEALR